MEQQISTKTIDELLDEKSSIIKHYNIFIFSKMYNVVLGICAAFQVDALDIALYDIIKVEEDDSYVIRFSIKSQPEQGEMFINISKDIVVANDVEKTKSEVQRFLLEESEVSFNEPEEQEKKRVLH